MVTSQELVQQREQAQRTRTQLANQRQQVIQSVTSKKSLLSNGGLQGRQSRASTIQQAGQETAQEKALSSYEAQLSQAEEQVKAQESYRDLTGAYNTALALYNQGIPAQGTGGDVGRILREMYKNYFNAQKSYEKKLTEAQNLPAVTSSVLVDNFVGPRLPEGWKPPVEKKGIGSVLGSAVESVRNVGAGVGNLIRGQSFDTPVRTNIGTDLYPSGVPSYTPTPEGTTAVKTTSGIKYIPNENLINPNRNINIPIKTSFGGDIKLKETKEIYNPTTNS
jgi:hypothetical protein